MHLIGLLLLLILCPHGVFALWPAPGHVETGSDVLRLSRTFKIEVWDRMLHKQAAEIGDLMDSIDRAEHYLRHDNMQRLVIGRGRSSRAAVHSAPELAALQLGLISTSRPILSVAEESRKPFEELDESYTLTIPSGSNTSPSRSVVAHLRANTTLGLVRGLQTFSQLVYALPDRSRTRYILDTPILIRDAPAFPHRALMIDTSRTFIPVSNLVRTLDAMSWTKLNVLHWHATDSQSWPLFVPAHPELSKYGAYSSSKVYSRADIAYIQQYAGALGISILLEIDMPGHAASIAESHPEHLVCLGLDERWPTYSAEPPTGQLKLGNGATRAFAERVVGSAASMMHWSLFSTGGDEVNAACYLHSPTTSGDPPGNNSTLDSLLSEFTVGIHDELRRQGKTPVVWEEMILNHDLHLPLDTIVTVWISSKNVRAVADAGYRIIHASSDYFYLDCGAGEWVGSSGGGRLRSWCDPFKSWQKIYSFDPLDSLDSSQHHLVLGGEALLWTEQAGPENLDSIIWPRAAAAAEVFWSGGSRNATEALPRLHDWRYRTVNRGVAAIQLQPEFCAIRPHLCDLPP